MTDFDKKLNRGINDVRRGIKNLRLMGLKIKIDKNVETMMGNEVDHIYAIDYSYPGSGGDNGEREIILQKHLFTV